MKLTINKIKNESLNKDEIKITIEYSENNDIENFIEYINEYEKKMVVVRQDNELLRIDFQDIILFSSDKRNVYCKTKEKEYKVKNTLYELEQNREFIRISRSCIININHLKSFDIGETGKLVAKLDDGSKEIVSRRKVKEIMKYTEERSI